MAPFASAKLPLSAGRQCNTSSVALDTLGTFPECMWTPDHLACVAFSFLLFYSPQFQRMELGFKLEHNCLCTCSLHVQLGSTAAIRKRGKN
eukprot:1140052-Pelagomonas_calceolata.AAC.1